MSNSAAQKSVRLGNWMVFFGAVFWSLNSPLVKYIQLDSLFVCGLRSLIAGVTLAVFIRPRRLNWSRWTVLYLFSYAGLCISIIAALHRTSATIAIGMQYSSLVWLFLGSVITCGRSALHWKKLLPVVLILTGVVIFIASGSGSTNTGNLIALSEGIFFTCMTISSKKASGTNPLGLTAIANLFTGFVVFLFFSPQVSDILTVSAENWRIMLILGVVQIGAGYSFYNLGLRKTTPQKASIIAIWEMILGPAWVALWLKEYPTPQILIGFVVILVGMLLDALLSVNTEPIAEESPQPGFHC